VTISSGLNQSLISRSESLVSEEAWMTFSKTPLVVMRPKAPRMETESASSGFVAPAISRIFDGVRALIDQGHHPFKFRSVGFALNVVDQIFEKRLVFQMDVMLFRQIPRHVENLGADDHEPRLGQFGENVPVKDFLARPV
jgi:hypothetical protein